MKELEDQLGVPLFQRRHRALALTDAGQQFYAAAARYSAGTDRIDLLIRQADALRFGGRWDEARPVLRLAATLARGLGRPGSEAIALIHLERLTWSYGLHENQLTEQIREVLERLPPGEAILRAQVQATLALRLGIAERKYEGEQADFARAALLQVPAAGDSPARADILIGVRGGLQDYLSPAKLLEYDKAVLLGSKHRFIGLAHLAAAQPAQAAEHLARAVAENGDFAAVQTRTRFDLARALIQQRAGHAQGIAEMADVQRRAGKLGMVNLAAQAAAELDRPPGGER